MNLKAFFTTFFLVYISISLPAIVGIGYVIDWIPEATWYQKFKGYVMDGLQKHFLIKTIIASIVGIIVSVVITNRRNSE